MAPGVDPAEKEVLEAFLESCTVETVPRPRSFARGMSSTDNAALTLAIRRKADILLCDERVTRMMAEAEGIRPLGTLGVLLRAQRAGLMKPAETRRIVDLLVGTHSFRIGVELYQAVLAELESKPQRRNRQRGE
jgi:predicted nucleic acid-binding protein